MTGIIAVALSLLAIMFYVWLRFEWQFAVGAVVSLFHDVVVVVGVFSLFQLQFDLTIVAALLTIIGYSINDTVVVFDRVRENLRKYKKMPLQRRPEPLAERDAEPHDDDDLHRADRGRLAAGLRRAGDLRLRAGDDDRPDRRHLLLDLGGDRHRAPARGQARLGDQGRQQGRHAVRHSKA